MSLLTKTKEQLIQLCKQKSINIHTKMKKNEIINLLQNKKNNGQFYTTNSTYILDGFSIPNDIKCVIEPFAGKGDIIDWIITKTNKPILAYDIQDIKLDNKINIIHRDTLENPPDYKDSWIITNPPYLARNKSNQKDIYDKYETNDLYKCFINSFVKQGNLRGGIIIVPASFFLSPGDTCRHNFMKMFKINRIKYFSESVFDDTKTTVVCFSFEKSNINLESQDVEWLFISENIKKLFNMCKENDWIVGGDIYKLPFNKNISITRYIKDKKIKPLQIQTFMTLRAIDTGTKNGRISLNYKKDYVFGGKDSRTLATIIIKGINLSEDKQIELCKKFNQFIEKKREETYSLFLPEFREYSRKRIPFELAYRIINYLLYKSN